MRSGSETASTPASTVTDPHLTMTRRVYPRTPDGCEECLELGTEWVHLRPCLTCGHVGCCDASPHRHAHAHAAGHPIARSFDPGESWQWCYVDERMSKPRELAQTPDLNGVSPRLDEAGIAALAALGRRRVQPEEVLFREGDRHCQFLSVPAGRLMELIARDQGVGDLILRAYLTRWSIPSGLGAGLRIIGPRYSPGARNRLLYRWLDLDGDLGAEALLARTDGVDSWVPLEGSPLLAHDTPCIVDQAESLHRQAVLGNLFIKIPGTAEGLPAIEECIYAGVPVNMPLLFSAEQHRAAARAYQRGVQRRIRAGLNPAAGSVASLFVSRWEAAVADRVPDELRNRLGIAVAKQAYRELLAPARWARLANGDARPQRLLWAPTSVTDPRARDVLYVEALAAPFIVGALPDQTLQAFAASWQDLLARIGARYEQLARTV